MMKINCDIITDLLPLYADELVNEATRERVEAHLESCKRCRERLVMLKTTAKVPKCSAKEIKKTASGRVFLPILAVILMVLTLIGGMYVYSAVPVWLSCEEAVVEIRDSKTIIVLEVTDRAQNMLYTAGMPGEPRDALGISFWGYRNDWIHPLRRRNTVHLSGAENYTSIWYREGTDNQQNVLLQGDAQVTLEPVIAQLQKNGEDIMRDNTLVYVFYISLWAGLGSILIGFLLRKKKCGKTVCYFGLALLCCAASCIFVTDGKLLCVTFAFSEMSFLSRFPVIVAMAGLSFGTMVSMIAAYKVLRRSK